MPWSLGATVRAYSSDYTAIFYAATGGIEFVIQACLLIEVVNLPVSPRQTA